MRVVFGWHLDGPTWPETADGTTASLGTAVVGPNGLLRLLETRLGLAGPDTPWALRIAQYRARLAAADNGTRFYSASLEIDGWATARLLLGWRDALISAGWKGTEVPGGGQRLDTLAAVEAVDAPLAAGPADRLRVVLNVLSSLDEPVIDDLHLAVPDNLLPRTWRQAIDYLAATGTRVVAEGDMLCSDGDLGALAQGLLRGQRGNYSNDGTIAVVEADDEWLAAQAVAGWLASEPEDNRNVVIIRGQSTGMLDEACHRLGLPRIGSTGQSPWRGALQVLPLAFENAWAPANVHRLMELLTLPQSPIPSSVASLFAAALQEAPGIGGPAWQEAWRSALQRRRERLDARGSLAGGALERKLATDEAEWRDWLEGVRFDPMDGMLASTAAEICRRVQRWALKRAAVTDDSVFQTAAGHAGALAQVIDACGLVRIPKIQLDRMLDAVVADGVSLPHGGAEAAPWSPVDTPGQIWKPASIVLWWGFLDPGATITGSPWSTAECSALDAAGCLPEPPALALRREAWAWRRPVLQATERLILVKPRTLAGEAAPSHPLWHEIGPLLSDAGCVVHAGASLQQDTIAFAGRTVRLTSVAPAEPPVPRRSWTVAAGAVTPRERESASSLQALLGCPFAWVLRYRAGVRAGVLRSIPEGAQLIGTLAHAVFAQMYGERTMWTPAEAERRATALFDTLLPVLAAPLLLPGWSLERERARAGVAAAARTLTELIVGAKLTIRGCEVEQVATAPDGTRIEGIIDLLLADAAERLVIVDLKWSGSDKYRRAEIAEGRPIQLAVYSRLVGDGAPVPAGYFMLNQQRLLFTEPFLFPDHAHVPGTDLAAVWDAAWQSRQYQLGRLGGGTVVAAGVADDDEVPVAPDAPIALEPPCQFCDYGRLCGAGSTQP